jgi:3-isopropylmalate/(R)-2-methylmalate dehydratase small subunit
MGGSETHRVRMISGTVSTDDIIPGQYKHMYSDPKELAPHVFENLLPGFAATLVEGDAIWSDSIFGIGSSREQAVTALLAAGPRLIIAPRFGRIFFRNAWNLGLGLIEANIPRASAVEGTSIAVDWTRGRLSGAFGTIEFAAAPPKLMEIRRAGGLLNWVIARQANARAPNQEGRRAC